VHKISHLHAGNQHTIESHSMSGNNLLASTLPDAPCYSPGWTVYLETSCYTKELCTY